MTIGQLQDAEPVPAARPATDSAVGMTPSAGTRDAAGAVLTGHRDDGAGLCAGCRSQFGHLKPFPCDQARWAHTVLGAKQTTWPQAAS